MANSVSPNQENPSVTTADLLETYFPIGAMTGRAVFVEGPPGCGKSAVTRVYSKNENACLLDTRFGSYDITDVKGMPFPNREISATEFFPVRAFPTKKNVEKGLFGYHDKIIWLWDEVGHAPQSILRQMFEIVHERAICNEPLHESVQIIMLSNRIIDKAGVAVFPAPLPTRMFNVRYAPTFDEWYGWGIDSGKVRPEILAYFKRHPAQLDEFDPQKLVPNTPYCCRRSVELLSDGVSAYRRLKGERASIPQHLCSSAIGQTVGEAIHAQFDIVLQLPTMDEIVADPSIAKLPDSIGGKLIVSSMIEQLVSAESFDAVVSYLKRMPKDFELAALVPAFKRKRDVLSKAPGFKAWAMANRTEVA